MSSIERYDDSCGIDAGQEVDCTLVIARGDGAELLELAEEVFDEMALLVEFAIVGARLLAAGNGGNHRHLAGRQQGRDDARVGVEGSVRQERVGLQLGQKGVRALQVVGLAGGEQKANRVAQRVDQGVDFGAQPAPAAPDRLVAAVFFGAPALC